MDFKEKIRTLLEKNLTERSYKLWIAINDRLPDIWNKSTSSTGKHHKRQDGSIPNQGEHTFEMLHSAIKIMRLFDIKSNTSDCDILLLSIVFHDSLKYGIDGNDKYTAKNHDQLAANMIEENKQVFLKLFTEDQINELIDSVRYHSGRWTYGIDSSSFNFNDRTPKAMFVHMLDMLSAEDCLKF